MRVLLLVVIVLTIAGVVMAGQPLVGIYKSPGLSGATMLSGRFSESWVGGPGQVGNTINAQSLDSNTNTLATEWRVWCASVLSPPTVEENTIGGDGSGTIVYHTVYDGGYFWLSQNGPWGNGEDYTGTITDFSASTTYNFLPGGVLLNIVSDIVMQGDFDGYDGCMTYSINNAAFDGDTNGGPFPTGDYPPLIDSACAVGPTMGGWGIASDITLAIHGDCTIATQKTSWGQVKARYQ
jgi:hypothetical protein